MTVNKADFIKVAACLAMLAPMKHDECGLGTLGRAGISNRGETGTMKLVAEYKKNSLEDVSSDGQLLLFYQSGKPVRTFSLPLGGGKGKTDQQESYNDVLRVVDRESGREIGRTGVRFYPSHEQFIPGTRQVFYSEPKPDPEVGEEYKLWDPNSGRTQMCLDGPEPVLTRLVFLDQQHVLATGARKSGDVSGDLLFSLTLPDCKLTTIGPVDPTNPKAGAGGAVPSPNKRQLSYLAYGQVVVWDVQREEIVTRLTRPVPLGFGDQMAYTPDGNLLIVDAHTRRSMDDSESYILLYDTQTHQLVRRQQVPGYTTALAVSPDSRTVAVAYLDIRKDTEQGIVALYDIATGKELVAVTHPRVKHDHNDPWAAEIGRVAFTPDGRYLLSSTYDTRIWKIGNP
jgi:hypothetical protein